jgi:hypothetical protein
MRQMQVVIQCSENLCGSIIADMTERKGVTVAGVSVIAELPAHRNGKARGNGATGRELIAKLAKAKPDGFTTAEAQQAFLGAGMKASSAAAQLAVMVRQRELTSARTPDRKGKIYRSAQHGR